MTELFRQLSIILCGDESLSPSLSEEYFDVLASDPSLILILEAYQKIVSNNPVDIFSEIQTKLLVTDTNKEMAKKIIKLWYLGRTENSKDSLKGKNHYFHYEALIWKVLHAHPTGLTGGYFGYWAYKPEN